MRRLISILTGIALILWAAGAESAVSDAEADVRPEPVPLPGPAYPYAASDTTLSLSAGPIWASDQTLDVGLYATGGFTFRLSPNVALGMSVGNAILADAYYGGELSVNPLMAYVLVILPVVQERNRQPGINLIFGMGGGTLVNDHTYAGVEDTSFVSFQTGIDWQMPEGSRFFVMSETMSADVVYGDRQIFDPGLGGMAVPYWDLQSLTILRVGIEFPF